MFYSKSFKKRERERENRPLFTSSKKRFAYNIESRAIVHIMKKIIIKRKNIKMKKTLLH